MGVAIVNASALYGIATVWLLCAVPVRAQLLMAHVSVSNGPPQWSYTVANDEPPGSQNYISSFYLTVNAPIVVAGSPSGWDSLTDGATYVIWFNADSMLPYPHDVAPGAALNGFVVESSATASEPLAFGLAAWDHGQDAPGPMALGTVSAPSTVSSVPEPAAPLLWASSAALVVGPVFRARIQRKR